MGANKKPNQRLPIFINKKIQTNTDIKFKSKYKSQKDWEKRFQCIKGYTFATLLHVYIILQRKDLM